jgi:type III restriction enzyme
VKLLLKDFQTEAVGRLVKHLRRAANEARTGDLQSVCLSSPTGSGKTVMVTAAIERILQGDDDAAPEPEATFLWVTDQPELNEQTRRKMLASSSVLTPDKLLVVDASFDQETFRPRTVHFLNIQKLGKEKGLVTPGDSRTFTIWETVRNTVETRPGKFYVLIDEAHRGMSESARARNEATTIIQKFIKGSAGEIPPVPLVFGISATPERFTGLVGGAGRTNRTVDIKPEDVRESGLIKDIITLYHPPKEAEHADMTMLREAVRSWRAYSKSWEEYCTTQGEPVVRPILVVQVQDAVGKQLSKTDIAQALRILREEAGDIETNAIAHSFQEGTRLALGDQEVRYIAPPDVQADPDVRVVLFKSSLNTGWDCPRAEVMMSFRSAADSTLIAQLVGRMVRTPLARRVDANEYLNTVALYLPHYDAAELETVIERLTKPDAENMTTVEVRRGTETVQLKRADASEKSFEALAGLPTYTIPRHRRTSEVKRLMKLARLLAHDEIDEKATDKAAKKLLDTLRAEYGRRKNTTAFKALIEEKAKVRVRAVNFTIGDATTSEGETVELVISPENLDDGFEAAGRRLGEGLHKAYWRSRVEEDASLKEKAKLELIALCFLEADVVGRVETEAKKTVQAWLQGKKAAVAALPEAQRQEYDDVRRLASEPEEGAIAYPLAIEGKKDKQTWKKHLYIDDKGVFPAKLNHWESKVIEAEIAKGDVVGWLRNVDRKPWSLCVPYELSGEWRALYPDFLVVRKAGKNLVVDILDPHLLSLEDAPAKAAGLAKFAAKHSDGFGRIELIIIDENDKMKRLDLSDETVRDRVKAVISHQHLKQLFDDA